MDFAAEHGHQYLAATAAVALAAACAAQRCRTACSIGGSRAAAPPPADAPARRIDVSGSPAERGALLGKELGDEVREVLKTWRHELHSRFAQPVAENPTNTQSDDAAVESWVGEFVASFLAGTEYGSTTALERWAPGVVEELRGLADSASVSYDELLCMQHRAECERYGASACGGRTQREEVTSSVAVCGLRKLGCSALLAQSVELEGSRSSHVVVLEVSACPAAGSPNQPTMLFLAHAGMTAPLSGVNACGVAVVADLLPQLTCSVACGGVCAGFAVRLDRNFPLPSHPHTNLLMSRWDTGARGARSDQLRRCYPRTQALIQTFCHSQLRHSRLHACFVGMRLCLQTSCPDP